MVSGARKSLDCSCSCSWTDHFRYWLILDSNALRGRRNRTELEQPKRWCKATGMAKMTLAARSSVLCFLVSGKQRRRSRRSDDHPQRRSLFSPPITQLFTAHHPILLNVTKTGHMSIRRPCFKSELRMLMAHASWV
ncbi:hypothetical protein SUGI_0516620 [Cryptomeria japonica]|nr:hypothetical protein SUGI_0516620 [Cryptomeria japonica]